MTSDSKKVVSKPQLIKMKLSPYEAFVHTLESIIAKFVDVCEHGLDCKSCCHMWKGSKTKDHGQIVYKGKTYPAHRLVYILTFNTDLTSTDYICHKRFCSSGRCCNMNHVYKGSAKSNAVDRSFCRLEKWMLEPPKLCINEL